MAAWGWPVECESELGGLSRGEDELREVCGVQNSGAGDVLLMGEDHLGGISPASLTGKEGHEKGPGHADSSRVLGQRGVGQPEALVEGTIDYGAFKVFPQ